MQILIEPENRRFVAEIMGLFAMLFLWGNMFLFAYHIIRDVHQQKKKNG